MNDEGIKLHENDIILLHKEKKLILKRLAEIDREMLILSKYNRQILGRGKNE